MLMLLVSLSSLLSYPILPRGTFSWQDSIVEAVLLGILLVGVAIAARKRFPLWSHSWVVLAIATVVVLVQALAFILLEGQTNFDSGRLALLQLFSLLVVLLVLAFAVSQASKGLRYTFFVVAVFIVSGSVEFAIADQAYLTPHTLAITVSSLLVIMTIIGLIVMAAMVMSFVTGDSKVQRQSLWVLIALILIFPIFRVWGMALNALDTGLLNLAGIISLPILFAWIYTGLMFLIAWRLGILVAYLDERNNRNDPLRGAPNAC